MAAFPCPYCGHPQVSAELDESDEAKFGSVGVEDRCPKCAGPLQIAYRYRLSEHHGPISGGELYRAVDDGFGKTFAVVFVAEPEDRAAVERFVEGTRLFADLRGYGLVKIHEVGSTRDPRPYLVMDWLEGGTLDKVIARRAGGLEQAALLELVSDLLTGLSKAHRSMPAIVHGHIHPGKIGFRQGNRAVLFGFEWATHVSSQASQLADTFTSVDPSAESRSIASDLRQLGVAFCYAATGEWIGDDTLAQQRVRARAKVPGPLGRLIDRLLGAGFDGYRSAVDASFDFEDLMRGVDRWQAPSAVTLDRSEERMGTAWAPEFGGGVDPKERVERAGDAAGEDDWEEDEDEDEAWPISTSATPPSARAPGRAPSTDASSSDFAAWAAERQAQARAEALAQAQARIAAATATPAKGGRLVLLAVGAMVVFGTCVAGILEDSADDYIPPPPRSFEPQVQVEPIPPPSRDPDPVFEADPVPELLEDRAPVPVPATLAGTFVYTGTISGPTGYAGLALDETCEIWIEPTSGSPLNCRWYVDCGQPRRRIYGGNAGYSTCTVDDDGRMLHAEDEDDDAPDGAFFADFESDEPMLVVLDRWTLPPVHVMINVDEGKLSDDPIPKVAQAPRVPSAVIAERIAADDYPTLEPGVLAEDW